MHNARRELISMLPKLAVGAEIGVWKGDFSAELIKGASPKKLYLIDPWVVQNDDVHRNAWYGNEQRVNMEQIHENVLQRFLKEREDGSLIVRRAFSKQVLGEFPDGYFDFIYIDGDHEYSAVRCDCFTAFDKVKPGGFICGDDYSITGWWRDGVVRAFHDLLHDRAVIARYVRANQIMVEKLANQPA
jgi:hypothetical protein